MKIRLSSRGLFLLGFLMLVVTNLVVLIGAVFNRSGEPESQLTLTERELQLPYRVHAENSGLALRLTWRALGKNRSDWRTPAWLNAEKLEQLGFHLNRFRSATGSSPFYRRPLPKDVFIVLENDGKTYQEAVKRAEAALDKEKRLLAINPGDKRLQQNFETAEKRLARERVAKSRLFAIDAGLDAKTLRQQYADRTRFIIVKGRVKPGYAYHREKNEVTGHIADLSGANIHVALQHRKIFDAILSQDKATRNESGAPRYEVKLAYGSRLEPWIVSVHPVGGKPG